MVNGGSPVVMTLYITSDVNTTYNVEIYGGPAIQSGTLIPNQVISIIIPENYFINSEGLFTNKAIHVTAAKPIVVYSFITRSQASAATLALPVNVLGKQYTAMSFTQISNELNSNSYFTIVAVEDNTTVEIIPTAATKSGWAPNSVNNITLNKGDIYQVLGSTNGATGVDLSGSTIRSVASGMGSCKRIAVFSGSGKLAIGCAGSSDNLYQQLYPVGTWGKKYITVPSYNQPNNYYRVLESGAGGNVYVNGVLIPPASFTNGFYEFFNNIPNVIESDRPISVTQYFTTQNCSGNTSPYDPDMIVLNPVEQNIDNVTLISSNLTVPGLHQHHLHIIMRNQGAGTTAFSTFKFDNAPVPVSLWVTHPADPEYSYLYLTNVSESSHTLSSDSGFNALAYGYGNAETYGYSAGTNVRDLYTKAGVSTLYGIEATPSVCTGSPFKFKISLPYLADSIKWDFGTPPNPPIVIVRYPTLMRDSTTTLNGKPLYWYSTPGTYNYGAASTYPFIVTTYSQNTDGCGNTQELNFDLAVFDPPVADFSNTLPKCVAEQVQFTDKSVTVKPTYRWSWDFGDPSTGVMNNSILKNPVHLFSTPGTYSVKYSNITTVGCISNTVTKQVIIPGLPTATISGNIQTCINTGAPVITFTGSGGSAPYTFSYNINSGAGAGSTQTISSTSGNTATLPVPVNSPGTYVYSLISIQNTGSSLCLQPQSGTATVKVNPLPTATINGTTSVCLNGPSQNILFTGSGSTPPYTFTYTIDKGSGAGPNLFITTISGNSVSLPVSTSTAGSFKYSLVNVKDASPGLCGQLQNGSATIVVTDLPTASISGSAEICVNTSPVNILFSAKGGQGPFTFAYNINGGANLSITTITGNSVLLAVPNNSSGLFSYNLVSVSDASCSQLQTGQAIIKINAVPIADFKFTMPSCETGKIQFTDASVANNGIVNSWLWNFNDSLASGTNPGISTLQNPQHIFNAPGTYKVVLTVTTDKGCTSIPFGKNILISPRPKARFITPEVCLSDAFAQFIDSSSMSSGTIINRAWNFGDPGSGALNNSTLQNPQHRYNAVGNYIATLVVTSDNGCTDTLQKSFTVNGDIPIANFNSLMTTSLCSNDSVVIQDGSTVNFGNITKVEIYWDNAAFPTVFETDENPVPGKNYRHLYSNFQSPLNKTFAIRYRAYSGISCVNDQIKTLVINASPKILFNNIPSVCLDAKAFAITQAREIGAVPGAGIFSGAGISASGIFDPAVAGAGTHKILYTFIATNGGCKDTASQKIIVFPFPSVNAGPDRVVLEGGSIILQPTVRANEPEYLWLENKYLNNNRIANPLSTPVEDIKYTLTVTDRGGCSASDDVLVTVLLSPKIPNTFSPNGDGINDLWEIKYLDSYPGNSVLVFTRAGQKIFESKGYITPWNGKFNGKPLPIDTYYYIIEPGNGRKAITGYITIIK